MCHCECVAQYCEESEGAPLVVGEKRERERVLSLVKEAKGLEGSLGSKVRISYPNTFTIVLSERS